MFRTRTLALAAIPLTAALLLAGCTTGSTPTSSSNPSASSQSQANSADEMFATMMIPHHEQAVEMSDMLLAKDGVTPEVAELAQQIKDAQAPEIEQMKQWLTAWGAPYDDSGMGGMDHGNMGDGMMSDDDMAALDSATGAEAARLYLEQMILHHEGAIDMAKAELKDGSNPDALALAEAIVTTQSAEIDTMRKLLAAD